MGGCLSCGKFSRQDAFSDIISSFGESKIDNLKSDGNMHMVVGRVSATDELLTGPLSESPCVGYFLEVAEWGFTGDILNNKGYGYKRIYSERRNVAFNISDPSAPDKVVEIPATEEFAYGVNDIPDTKQRSFELLTDVVVAHICPSTLMYEVPHIYDGDIQATKNLIRGYPMRFGMLDGEGEGDRVELPLNIDELLLKCNAKRYRKTKWAILKSFFGCGSGDTRYGESIKGGSSVKSNASDFYDTKLLICEMSIRVNDQMNVVATFKEGAKNKLVASHMSADTLKSSKNVISGEDHASEWSLKVKESFHRLTRDRDAILVAKFPKIGHVEELSATTVFEQEKGAMHGFNLARSPQKNTSSGLGRSELKEHGYLLSEDAKQRLGEQGMNYRTVDDPMSPASRLLG